jgi:hypothetical protein
MARKLFSGDEYAYDGKLPVDPGSIKHRVTGLADEFRVSIDAFSSRGDITLQANMFLDADYELTLTFKRSNGKYDVYHGVANGEDDSDVVFTTDGKTITLSLYPEDRGFQVVPLEEGIYLVEEINRDLSPDCGVHSDEHEDDDEDDSNSSQEDKEEKDSNSEGSIIKVLIIYTPAVRVALNKTPEGVDGFLRQTVEDFNFALEKSGINALVSHIPVERDVEELPSSYCAIAKAMKKNPTIRALRAEHQADLVSIIRTPEGRSCANCLQTVRGNRMSAFSAVNLSQARQRHSFIHEVGHNLGAAHNPGTDNPGFCAEETAQGNAFRAGRVLYGTLMSYDGKRILRFSGPDVYYKGVATGTQTRNNAATIRKVVPKAAAYAGSFDNV